MSRIRHGRRKSLQSTGGPNDTLDILGVDGTEEKLWFPIGTYFGLLIQLVFCRSSFKAILIIFI